MTPEVLEANYLEAVWCSRDSPESYRRSLLKMVASVVIQRGPEWDYAATRAAVLPPILERECFICGAVREELHRHHAIQVQNGGSNSPRNIVPLCRRCHADIHPWQLRPVTRGWSSVGEIADQVLDGWRQRRPSLQP